MNNIIATEDLYSAGNYHPLPIVLVRGEGVYLWDSAGRCYLDMMSAYSAVSHGHCHPVLVNVLTEQARRLSVTSRAFHTETLAPFLEYACHVTGQDKALPINSGAEAVETAIKAVRKWAYTVKHVQENQAEVIVCSGNFHGRTTTVISFSSESQYRQGFGPLTPGFKIIPYGDAQALADAIGRNTAAFLVEPIQGEAGIRIPPAGYLKDCARICAENNVLFIADEIQTGLGRTGKFLACEHEGVKPDGLVLGKALGGGMLPVSMFLSKEEVMNVFTPGDHGSTFGGNALSAAVGLAALQTLDTEDMVSNAAQVGAYFLNELQSLPSPLIKEVRGKGLFIGVELHRNLSVTARDVCLRLMADGLLTKDTHETVIRLCPPLIITREQVDTAMKIIKHAFKEAEKTLQ